MNECLENNGGCWQDKTVNLTACRDTFRGRVCECLLVDGVQFKGDGYSHWEGLNVKLLQHSPRLDLGMCFVELLASPTELPLGIVINVACRQKH
ncbi:vacuolar-sorting receptor 3 [Gossypium raimondii]|uniref:Uncharacterized protein n=1 Tax=Gossypium raimondii TaxID=29730 RepID=A0A0D2NLM3_GOSRA|nr:vacuolar-sorting receptor 3 [Gossypium raimondii]KJB14258.1 hypothetical protein B456_002G116100 [Gossypium raimondii]